MVPVMQKRSNSHTNLITGELHDQDNDQIEPEESSQEEIEVNNSVELITGVEKVLVVKKA